MENSNDLELPDMENDFIQLLSDIMNGKREEEPIPEIPEDSSLILLMGLDESGKTTLISKFVYDELFKPSPTDLFDHTKFEFNGRNLFVREIGGRNRFRDRWTELYKDAEALIWVVDIIDRGRVIESREELEKVLNHPSIQNLPVLVIFNKIDSRIKMTHEKCDELMQISRLFEKRKFIIIETTHLTCQNMREGFQWLIENMKPKRVPPKKEDSVANESQQNNETQNNDLQNKNEPTKSDEMQNNDSQNKEESAAKSDETPSNDSQNKEESTK